LDRAFVLIGRRGTVSPGATDVPPRIILGLSLFERVLLTAFQGGVREFILIGEDADSGKAILSSLANDKRFKERDLRLEVVSLSRLMDLICREDPEGKFWLMEGDLVFAPAILEKAAQADPGEDRDLLVVNRLETGES